MLQLLSKIFRKRLLSGIILTVISFGGFLIDIKDHTLFTSIFFGGAFYLGFMFIADWITIRFAGISIISSIYSNQKHKLRFTIATLVGGALFGFMAADISGFFYFPYWSYSDYVIIGFILGGWTFYFLTVIIPYEATKVLLDKYFPFKKDIRRYFKWEKYAYLVFKYVSVILFSAVILHVLIDTNFLSTFTFNQQIAKAPLVTHPYLTSFAFFASIVFFCEYIEYERKKSSLFKDIIHGYWNPLIALLIIGFLMGLTNEVQNLGVFLWRYNNMPFADIQIFTIPLIVIISWPTHILAILEVWRAFGDKDSKIAFDITDPIKKNI
ncbi:MAG: hypothetical protein ACMG57_05510 [Candidatus Dojkabacteria bacterium]